VVVAAVVESDGHYNVEVYADSGGETTRHVKPFESRSEAETYLSQAGYVPALAGSGRAQYEWVPRKMGAFEAAHPTSSTPARSETLISFSGWCYLALHVVRVVFGYGFRFALTGVRPEEWGMTGTIDTDIFSDTQDPIFRILTTDMIRVRAVGTWPSIAAAERAGLDFFDSVKTLVGEELLHMLLTMEVLKNERRREEGHALDARTDSP